MLRFPTFPLLGSQNVDSQAYKSRNTQIPGKPGIERSISQEFDQSKKKNVDIKYARSPYPQTQDLQVLSRNPEKPISCLLPIAGSHKPTDSFPMQDRVQNKHNKEATYKKQTIQGEEGIF